MFEKTWLPKAMAIGIDYYDFWSMNPHIVNIYLDAYKQQQKQEMEVFNIRAHLLGRYFVDSLACTVGNMMKKKGAKPIEYPAKPYDLSNGEEKKLSVADKKKQTELLFAKLNVMKANFELERNIEG